ncbi:hypothetical protein ASG90_20350 [Nocardioides sp. Soil797]|nr:hypothetical protein ASG90_20350 [Nocardioides sp. Soil797]
MSTMSLSPTTHIHTGQLRLTRRGRVVVFVAAMLVVMGAALFLGNTSMATNHSGTEQPTQAVVVESGDTLWSIAGEVAGDGEVRDMVHAIKQLNALDSSVLMTGQTIFVPIS